MTPAEKKMKLAEKTVRQPKPKVAKLAMEQSVIVKTSEAKARGLHPFDTSRYALGYVLSGTKCIYTGDLRRTVVPGELFFLNKGLHYFEDIPAPRRPFEQIVFFYTPEQISSIAASFSVQYHVDTGASHSCADCQTTNYVIDPGWSALKHFFATTNKHLRDGYYSRDSMAETLALTELVYQIITRPEGCLRTRVLQSSNAEKELMERQLRDYVFSDITLEEFARRTNRCLSSFKKTFKLYFKESPHRWVLRQRLMHARQQIISTERPIEHIARDCCFNTPSHFIRVFHREFGLTPTRYRLKYSLVQ